MDTHLFLARHPKFLLFSLGCLVLIFLVVGCSSSEYKGLSLDDAYNKANVECISINGVLNNLSIVKTHNYFVCIKDSKIVYDYDAKTLELKKQIVGG